MYIKTLKNNQKNKNKNNKNKNITHKNKNNELKNKYSDGFIRRMSEPFHITKLTDLQIKNLNIKNKRILSDDEKMDIFMAENSSPFKSSN